MAATTTTVPVATSVAAPAAVPLNDKRVYWAIKVDDAGFEALTAGVHAIIAESGYNQLVPKAGEFHATLLFMGKDRSKEGPIVPFNGARTELRLLQVVATPRLACVQLAITDPAIAALSTNACAHLTLALAPKVPAKESNDVLEAVNAGKAQPGWVVLPAMPSGTGEGHIPAVTGVVTGM
jgi:hypothetical protein